MIFKRFRFYIYLVNNYTRAYKCRIYSACFVNVTVNFNRAVMYGKVPDTCSIKDICGFFAAACPDDDLAFTSCQKLLSGSFFHQSALVNDAVIGSNLCKLIKDMTGNYKCDTEKLSSAPAETSSATKEALPETTAAEAETAASESQERTDAEIIQEIVTYHGCNGDAADTKVNELLGELTVMDSRQGKLWTDIMDYWNYSNNDLQVNADKLPDDLPDDDTMVPTVLGFELNDDGTMQDELIGRLTVALACAEQYPNAYVICTGGGTAKANPDVTESGLMVEWMLEPGLTGTGSSSRNIRIRQQRMPAILTKFC